MKKILAATTVLFSFLGSNGQNCPGILVESANFEIAAGDTLEFFAQTKNAPAGITYNWAISAGKIIGSSKASSIKVDTKGLAGMFVTATVEIGKIPEKCASTASSTVEVIPGAQLVNSGTFTNGQDLKNAVQQFLASTQLKDPTYTGTGFIYLYKGSKTAESSMKIFKDAIIAAFEYNKILPHQYIIELAGEKKLNAYEMYLMQDGEKVPKPSN